MDLKKNLYLKGITLINFVYLVNKERETVRRWRNHEHIRKWMCQDHIISPTEHKNFIKGLKNDNKNFYWLAKNKKGEYLGVISLNRIDFKNKNAYLGIYANPITKLPGSSRLLIECLKELVFDKINLHTLRLEVIDGNERAISFYKKSGFSEEGRLKEFIFKDGKWHDVLVMGLLNKDKA